MRWASRNCCEGGLEWINVIKKLILLCAREDWEISINANTTDKNYELLAVGLPVSEKNKKNKATTKKRYEKKITFEWLVRQKWKRSPNENVFGLAIVAWHGVLARETFRGGCVVFIRQSLKKFCELCNNLIEHSDAPLEGISFFGWSHFERAFVVFKFNWKHVLRQDKVCIKNKWQRLDNIKTTLFQFTFFAFDIE